MHQSGIIKKCLDSVDARYKHENCDECLLWSVNSACPLNANSYEGHKYWMLYDSTSKDFLSSCPCRNFDAGFGYWLLQMAAQLVPCLMSAVRLKTCCLV